MDNKYIPKHKWVRTWPGEIDPHTGKLCEDFQTTVDGVNAGRIRLEQVGPKKGLWAWAGAYPPKFKKPIMPNTGYEDTAREACRRAEEYWQAMVEQSKS